MTLSKLHNNYTKPVDFLKAYPQAKLKYTVSFYNPVGVVLTQDKDHMAIKLLKNFMESIISN